MTLYYVQVLTALCWLAYPSTHGFLPSTVKHRIAGAPKTQAYIITILHTNVLYRYLPL